jgi:hypothetical protein
MHNSGVQVITVINRPECSKCKPPTEEIQKIPEGYKVTPNIGAHKLYYQKKLWNEARKVCTDDEGIFIF